MAARQPVPGLGDPHVSSIDAPTRLAGYLGEDSSLGLAPGGSPADEIRLAWGGPGATLTMVTWHFGDLDFALFEGDRGVCVQPALRSRAPWAGLVVGMNLGGTTVALEQRGRSVLLPEGHFTFFHGYVPYRISTGGPHRWLVCRLRFLRVGTDTDRVNGLLAGDMTSSGSAGSLLSELLRGSTQARDTLRPSGRLHCADAIHSLVRAVVDEAALPHGPRPANDSFGRYTQWLEERIQTVGLDAEAVATAHHVSVRQVRGVFAGNGSTVSAFVRERRLEHLRHDLLDPSLAGCTVATLARRWGMDNPPAVNRLFREQYGLPPAAYRRQNSGIDSTP
ncbi:hypothetical protein GCM10027519_21210 [Kineococcus endophyticus]